MNNLATSTTSQDNKQDVEMCNYGLVIWNSALVAFMDLGEIPLVILPSVIGFGLWRYVDGAVNLKRTIWLYGTTVSATTAQAFPNSPSQVLWEKWR